MLTKHIACVFCNSAIPSQLLQNRRLSASPTVQVGMFLQRRGDCRGTASAVPFQLRTTRSAQDTHRLAPILRLSYKSMMLELRHIIQKCICVRENTARTVSLHVQHEQNRSFTPGCREAARDSSWSRCPPRAAAPAAWPSWQGPAFPGPW